MPSKSITLQDVAPRTARGERQGSAKLTAEKVIEIRRLHEEGGTIMGIARAFGVSPPTIYAIIRGKTWRHVQDTAV